MKISKSFLIFLVPLTQISCAANNGAPSSDKSGIDLTNASGPIWHQLFLEVGGRGLPKDNTALVIRASGYKIRYIWTSEDSNAYVPRRFANYELEQEHILAYLASRFATVRTVSAQEVYFAFGSNVHGINTNTMPEVNLEGMPSSTAHLI